MFPEPLPQKHLLCDATPRPCRLWIGTSGYSYAEWVEAGFYPPDVKAAQMLAFYARRFAFTELNFTWYQMPKAQAIERMLRQVPEHFRFTAKLTRSLTHEIDPAQWPQQAWHYREGIAPLVQSSQLLAILIQLPPGFHRSPANRRYLAALLDALDGLPLAVEFRHASWATQRVLDELTRRRVTLVSVDRPELPGLFPLLEQVTNTALFYVRLHGRNAAGWRSGHLQQQFDYDYRDTELAEWANGRLPRLAAQAGCGVVSFNNHVRAQAPRNAARLMERLAAEGWPVK